MNAKKMNFCHMLEWETTFMKVKFLIKPHKILLVVRTSSRHINTLEIELNSCRICNPQVNLKFLSLPTSEGQNQPGFNVFNEVTDS